MLQIFRSRYATSAWIFCIFFLVSLVTRLALAVGFRTAEPVSSLALAFFIGAIFDLITASFVVAPCTVYLAVLPNRAARWKWLRLLFVIAVVVTNFLFLFTAIAEWIFWDEYASRFNFIAVDYLIYTHEVIGNIWQSYPVGKILALLALVNMVLSTPIAKLAWKTSSEPITWRARIIGLSIALILPTLLFNAVSATDKNRLSTDTLNELAGNGLYELASAARNNELDFLRLYASLSEKNALGLVQSRQSTTVNHWHSDNTQDRQYSVSSNAPEKHLNVVLISVESLGAEFVGAWGDQRGLTPNFDAISRDSLIFSRVYATGNRTVRGLEALSLAIPPTPGQSIVKRPNNGHLRTLGSIFKDKGYDSMFLYGGYSYFDNMEEFFGKNDYRVIDRSAIPQEKILYENIWGVADEHLFDLAISEIDSSLARSKGSAPVFAHIMTTSNHRPYTYPKGRIDIAPGTGREGAVKYSDWAIGHFINEAKKKPWFKDTLFVITADHGANARGSEEIPVDKYLIPVVFYAPSHLSPARVDRLMSQIDIASTVLGQLHFNYNSKFFGQDIFEMPVGTERAFVANYQTLGYLRNGNLVMLYPRKKVRILDFPLATDSTPKLDESTLKNEAIAWYEAAYLAFTRGELRNIDAGT